jgi:lipid-binding SYLF domain-containing protein
VLLVRETKRRNGPEPAFYNIGSANFGLQVGGDVSEILFVVRDQKRLEEFYRSEFKLDASMALGRVGEGGSLKGITADMVGYAKKKGPSLASPWTAPPRWWPWVPAARSTRQN